MSKNTAVSPTARPNTMSAPSASPGAAPPSDEDWRKSVPQSYRSEEVRNIAKVLASLEPGATSASKLMLAMRFEDAIFQSASSLSDYRKKLTKRLKKVQKSYKPASEGGTSADASSIAGAGVAGVGGGGGADGSLAGAGGGAGATPSLSSSSLPAATPAEAARRRDLEIERNLRAQFGDELRFIVLHASEAVEAMKEKHGASRAAILRQHTDNAEQWAAEIGLDGCDSSESFRARRRRTPRETGYLDRLRSHLEQRVDNIRSHVVKLTRPDLFLEETLVRLEEDMSDETADELAAVTRSTLERMGHAIPASDAAGVRKFLEKASAPAPIPRRGMKGDARDASLAHVEKVRAASQALVGYMALDRNGKAAVRGALRKAHAAAVDSVSHLAGSVEDDGEEGAGGSAKEVQLEDAWNRQMEYKSEREEAQEAVASGYGTDEAVSMGGGSDDEPDKKRRKLDSGSMRNVVLMQSRVLLSPGRRVPTNLRAALKRKGAELIQPPENVAHYASTRIRLEFGSAFYMTVNFTPLLVTIRALPEKVVPSRDDPSSSSGAGVSVAIGPGKSEFRRTIVDGGLPTFVPPYYGLRGARSLSVLGVPGAAASAVGHIVARKLEFASAHATHVLRRCFADLAGRAYATHHHQSSSSSSSDFEIEILESTALLRFLQIARATYCPGWQDAES